MIPVMIHGMEYLATTIVWNIPVGGGVRQVQLDHSFYSRKVEVFLDGEKQLEHIGNMRRIPQKFPFKIGSMECSLAIVKTDNVFGYSIEVDSKPLPVYKEQYQKKFDTWFPKIGGEVYRVVLDKVLLELYSNGEKIENDRHFMDNGAVTYFKLAGVSCRIEAQKTENAITNNFYTPEGSVPLDTKQDAETFKFDAERFFNSGFDNL